MKQLPHVSSLLYCQPWAILPAVHAELGGMYRAYLRGTLPAAPEAIEGAGRKSSGIGYEVDRGSGIAVLHVEGIICKHAPDILCGPTLADLAQLDGLIEEVAADSGIGTVVIHFNSPGGSVIGLDETAANLRDLAEEKRVVAYTDFQCCSAAYYLACACDEIYAAPSAVIGSIGTYIAALDDSRAWEMEGFELKLFRVGELKAIGAAGKPWTAVEEEFLQASADRAGGQFREWVAERRPGTGMEAMEGQWFFAKDAPSALHDGFHRDLPRLLAELMRGAEI